jgi:hypothetical protein
MRDRSNATSVPRCMAFLAMMTLAVPGHTEEWDFSISPLFLWGISIDGDATIGTQTAPLGLDFTDDVLENLDAVFTLHFEATRDRLTLFAEYQYVSLDPSVSIGPVEADIEFDNVAAEAGMGWRWSEDGPSRWELLAGLRYLDQEIEVEANLNLPPPPLGPGPLPIDVSGGDDWIHPFIGVRWQYQLNDRWLARSRGDFGYGGSDDQAINLSLMFDYRFRDWISAFVGYRYMDFDYEGGSGNDFYAYDAVQQGPLAGVSFYW